jgi:hypothetical protein
MACKRHKHENENKANGPVGWGVEVIVHLHQDKSMNALFAIYSAKVFWKTTRFRLSEEGWFFYNAGKMTGTKYKLNHENQRIKIYSHTL